MPLPLSRGQLALLLALRPQWAELVMIRACGALGAAAAGFSGLAYSQTRARASAGMSAAGDLMHPAHTTPLRSGKEFKSFLEANVSAGRTVFVRWIASPQ